MAECKILYFYYVVSICNILIKICVQFILQNKGPKGSKKFKKKKKVLSFCSIKLLS